MIYSGGGIVYVDAVLLRRKEKNNGTVIISQAASVSSVSRWVWR
jgi:hypothetical protein